MTRVFRSKKIIILLLLLIVAPAGFSLYNSAQAIKAPPALDSLDATVEQGRYLAKVGNCQTCHTTEHGQPFAGGLEFQTPFGTLYSTNITMHNDTGIGTWSFEDFYQSLKRGVRPDGTHLYPAFPYTAFAKMTDVDIASLFLYMQTIAPVEAAAPANQLKFPFNQRLLLAAWKRLFHDPNSYTHDPGKSAAWNRGAYLVEGPAHCGACHTPRNILGAERPALALSGGEYLDKVKSGEFREWSGVNLTPSPTGLEKWRAMDIAAYLKTGKSDHSVVHGPMNEVVMNSTRFLLDADAEAIGTYLKNIPPVSNDATPTADAETLRQGEIVYTVHCGSCHLPTGLGDEILGVSLAKNAIVQASNPASFLNVILYGPHLPPPPFVTDRTRMKMFGKRLSDVDIANVATYIRASFGNSAGAVTAEQVNVQR